MAELNKFFLDLDQWRDRIPVAVTTLQKQTALDLFARIVKKTPVKTGRARSSWTLAVNRVNRDVPPEGQKSYPAATAPTFSLKLGDTVWISNNLPYIVGLEQGHSRQAPQGMVALSMEEVRVRLDTTARTVLRAKGL